MINSVSDKHMLTTALFALAPIRGDIPATSFYHFSTSAKDGQYQVDPYECCFNH